MSIRRQPVCIGIDVGTSSLKALALGTDGSVIASSGVEYEYESPRPGWAQCNPEVWWVGACKALRALTSDPRIAGSPIAAVGLAGQMHGLVLVDADGVPTTPALMWNDQRTHEQCERMERELTSKCILEWTGNRLFPGLTAPKLLWIRANDPDALSRAKHMMLPKDFVRFKLSGEFHTDVADASGTALFDCRSRCWSQEMCAALNVPEALLPQAFESPVVTARVTAQGSNASGIPVGTPIIAGAGDQAAQAVGTGIVHEGQVSCTIGTSGVIFAATNSWRPAPAGVLHAFCHAVPQRWHLMGVTLCAGGSLRWFRDNLCSDLVKRALVEGRDPYELIEAEARSVEPGCEGLTFLPYLSGERAPHPDPNARGVFAGLSVRSTRAHMARSIFEGIACSLGEVLGVVRDCGAHTDRVRLSGGGARSALLRQMLTETFAVPTACVEESNGAAVGAALLAGVGGAIWPTVESATKEIHEAHPLSPRPGSTGMSQAAQRYAHCHRSLAGWFADPHHTLLIR